jgi:hypothetical protein
MVPSPDRSTAGACLRAPISPGQRSDGLVGAPLAGDAQRRWLIEGDGFRVLVEAETHVGDVQAVIRRARDKQRDLGGPRLILLLSESSTIAGCSPITPGSPTTSRCRRGGVSRRFGWGRIREAMPWSGSDATWRVAR